MNLDELVFDNTDAVAATGLTPTVIQTWANRGILSLRDNQRNPGPGQRRKYSALDIARIATTQCLISYGLTASTAAQIALRLERGPLSEQRWRAALEEGDRDIHILVVDDFNVAAVETGNDPARLAQLMAVFSEEIECGPVGEGMKFRSKAAIFNIGPDVSSALEKLHIGGV